jgi:hypothetical protein
MVSMLPTVDSRLFAIKGGNFQLPEKLLEAAAVKLVLGSEVMAIERADSSFYIHLSVRSTPLQTLIYLPPLLKGKIMAITFF